MSAIQRILSVIALAVIFTANASAIDAGTDTDTIFDETLASMKARADAVQQLLMSGKVGETLEGALAPGPGLPPTKPELDLMNAENADRAKLYEAMALLEKSTPEEMAKKRVERVHAKYKKGYVYREKEDAGRFIWWDGFTDEERLASYKLEFVTQPPPEMMAEEPFDVMVRVVDIRGELVKEPNFQGNVDLTIDPPPITTAAVLGSAAITDGAVEFSGVKLAWLKGDHVLLAKCAVLNDREVRSDRFFMKERLPTPAEIQAELPLLTKRLDGAKLLPISVRRNEVMTNIANRADRFVAALQLTGGFDREVEELREIRKGTGIKDD